MLQRYDFFIKKQYLCSHNFEIIKFLWHKKMYLRRS